MATATEKVKEALVGTEEEPQLSSQTRTEFLQHAKKDEETGEYYMGESEFINAIAPEGEDYVSSLALLRADTSRITSSAETLQSRHD